MSDFFGTQITLNEQVQPIQPLPEWAEEFFAVVAKALEQISKDKQLKKGSK
jgi:hypothetical protein